ncbi:hypothetical protein WN51_03357 [Melipona quadrifasciata]|uniref:Uncharacterized protein n=1 Tax=Melipona quadrifasciata TaxID=166423 RepID=A0A0N0U3W5_9HYME|nr:hypothetical protein WN51_03357 [Melipona quadrifasciata]
MSTARKREKQRPLARLLVSLAGSSKRKAELARIMENGGAVRVEQLSLTACAVTINCNVEAILETLNAPTTPIFDQRAGISAFAISYEKRLDRQAVIGNRRSTPSIDRVSHLINLIRTSCSACRIHVIDGTRDLPKSLVTTAPCWFNDSTKVNTVERDEDRCVRQFSSSDVIPTSVKKKATNIVHGLVARYGPQTSCQLNTRIMPTEYKKKKNKSRESYVRISMISKTMGYQSDEDDSRIINQLLHVSRLISAAYSFSSVTPDERIALRLRELNMYYIITFIYRNQGDNVLLNLCEFFMGGYSRRSTASIRLQLSLVSKGLVDSPKRNHSTVHCTVDICNVTVDTCNVANKKLKDNRRFRKQEESRLWLVIKIQHALKMIPDLPSPDLLAPVWPLCDKKTQVPPQQNTDDINHQCALRTDLGTDADDLCYRLLIAEIFSEECGSWLLQ